MENLKTNLIYFAAGALVCAFLMQRFGPHEPDKVTTKTSSSDDTKAKGLESSIKLSSKTTLKSTKPSGASNEKIVEKYVVVDNQAYDIDSKTQSHSETITQNNLLNIYLGGGVDLSLERPHPRFSGLVTYGNHAGEAVTDGDRDHSLLYHYRILSF